MKITRRHLAFLLLLVFIGVPCSAGPDEILRVPQYGVHEITLETTTRYANPYTDVEVWAEFSDGRGATLRRPAFWDGGSSWRIRFTPPDVGGTWRWRAFSSNVGDRGLHGPTGSLLSVARDRGNALLSEGPLRSSPGRRSVVHHSGKPFFMVASTAWASPFRATVEQVDAYAASIHRKGYNAVTLASLQTDMGAEGPNARDTPLGFARTFRDLGEGHLNQVEVGYFQYLDRIIATYLKHELVPVIAPLLHGYGWKGLDVIGGKVVPAEYVRYCKYLLARYGSQPAMWLLSVDGSGWAPGVAECGEMLEEWDAYAQPTGLHYNPCDDFVAKWAIGRPDVEKYCLHGNRTHQDAKWLDFQWAQTGHDGLHLYHKVRRMYDNRPTKAVANGEPTYEGMNGGASGRGWWQGEEAWNQLMHGGTMGVVYGAAGLWQWKITRDEPGWESWTDQPLSWREAAEMEGTHYVGLVGRLLKGLDLTDIERRWDLAAGKPLLAREGDLYVAYLSDGGEVEIEGVPGRLSSRWMDPRTGEVRTGTAANNGRYSAPDRRPWVLVLSNARTTGR